MSSGEAKSPTGGQSTITGKTEATFESSFLKAAIESIPILTFDNYSLWRRRVLNLVALMEISEEFKDATAKLNELHNIQLRTFLTSKIDSIIHPNIMNPEI